MGCFQREETQRDSERDRIEGGGGGGGGEEEERERGRDEILPGAYAAWRILALAEAYAAQGRLHRRVELGSSAL